MIQALWLYLPPYINSTADIIITSVTSTASSRRRRLQATAGSADVTTELDVGDAYTVAATSTALSSVVTGSKFLVGRTATLHGLSVSSKDFLLCNVSSVCLLYVACMTKAVCVGDPSSQICQWQCSLHVNCMLCLICRKLHSSGALCSMHFAPCISCTSTSLQCFAQKSAFLAVGHATIPLGLQTTLQTLGVAATSTSLLSTQSTVPGLYTSVCTLNNSTGTCEGESPSAVCNQLKHLW